jgi:hypothetical protein
MCMVQMLVSVNVCFMSNTEICFDNQGIVWEKGTEIVRSSVYDNLGTGWELCTAVFKKHAAAQYDFTEFRIITSAKLQHI